MNGRPSLEEREERDLAPYAAKAGRSLGRKHPEPEHPYRTAFQRDRDRVIHSSAFRRLKYKTQVYLEGERDYFRTRITHTLETSQIARTIARVLGLNEDLCEVLALAHDLGHPPFGHSGEDALAECMKNHGGFEHNLQSLRIVEILENRYPDFPGLNLTWETRESIRKHSVKPRYPVEPEYKPEWSPLLECEVVDLADYIAYVAHDVDDAIKAGLLTLEQMEQIELWRLAQKDVLKKYPKLRGELMVRQIVRWLIERMVTDLLESTEKAIVRAGIRTLDDVRRPRDPVVGFSPELKVRVDELYRFLYGNVYQHWQVERMHEKAKRFVRDLFEAYTKHPKMLPPQFQESARANGVERAVCDYIAGMTDRYAQEEHKKLFSPFEPLL